MTTHLGLKYTTANGAICHCFQMIDKPFPHGVAYAIRDYVDGNVVRADCATSQAASREYAAFIVECDRIVEAETK